ncbi:M55 family metallopeptidase [bacterium]|nr:M55 family metallopeptidase [bacterium]
MHVFISVDIEGITDVTWWWDEKEKGREEVACRRMTAEANAAVEGALAAGARKITVADSHGSMRNILPELLHPAATLVRGQSRPLGMMQGVDRKVDAAMLIGYHAMAGTKNATLAHTYTGQVHRLWVNGVEVGEIGFNARVAGRFGVPVVLLSGDAAACREAERAIPGITTVQVKDAMGYINAANDHPETAQAKIRKAATAALGNLKAVKPLTLKGAPRVRVELRTVQQADLAALAPGISRLDGYTVEYKAQDMAEAHKTLRAIFTLARAAKW